MRTILVIEDHMIILETICLILKQHGYNVLCVQNAQQAEEQFLGNKVDVVIMGHGLRELLAPSSLTFSRRPRAS